VSAGYNVEEWGPVHAIPTYHKAAAGKRTAPVGTREQPIPLIVDSDPGRADELVRGAFARFPDRTIVAVPGAREALAGASGVINATPIGMAKLPGTPIDAALLDAKQWVADCVYRPIDTALLGAARARGCATLDGGGMNVGQAVDAFRLFTGLDADPARVARHFAALIAAERAAA